MLLVLILTACKAAEGPPVSETPPASRPASQPAAPATCQQQTKTLLFWLDKILVDVSPIALHSSRLELVEREGSLVRTFGPVLELEFRGVKPMLGMVEMQLDDILKQHQHLIASVKRVRAQPHADVSPSWPTSPDRVPWYIAPDRRLSWGAVAYLAHLAPKKKVDTLRFLFWAKEMAPVLPPSSMDTTLKELVEKYNSMTDPSAPATMLKPLGEIKPHPKIAALFANCPKAELSLRHRHWPARLRKDLARQVRACNCKIEIPGLQAWLRYQLVWVFKSGPKSLLTVRLANSKTPNALELTLPSERPWQLAYKDLEQAVKKANGKPLRLLAK